MNVRGNQPCCKDRIYVLRQIGWLNLPALIVLLILRRIGKIHYLAARNPTLLILKIFIPTERLVRITPLGHIQNIHYGQALDIVDQVFSAFTKDRISNAIREPLIDRSSLNRIFKKELTMELATLFYLIKIVDDLSRNNLDVVLVESRLKQYQDQIAIHESSGVYVTHGFLFALDRLAYFVGTVAKRLALLAIPIILMLKSILNVFKRVDQEKYRHAVLIRNPKHQFKGDGKYFDFIIDDQLIKSGDVIFMQIAAIHPDIIEEHTARGRHFSAHLTDRYLFNTARSSTLFRLALNIVPTISLNLTSPIQKSVSKGIQTTVMNYLRWNIILERYRIDNLITFNDEQTGHIARNSVLNNMGTKTWYYAHSAAMGYCSNKLSTPVDKRHILWSYLYYDHYVTWNTAIADYIHSHPVKFKQTHVIGCLWSPFIKPKNEAFDPGKRIVVFDTSYIDNIDAGVVFYEDIIEYGINHPEVEIIFKPKKDLRDYGSSKNFFSTPKFKQIEAILSKLEHYQNMSFTAFNTDAYDLMSRADLVITHAISSPSIEALCSRKKAIYYDPEKIFPGSYYDSIPSFIVYDKEALWQQIDSLMLVTNEAFDVFINDNCTGIVEDYFDSKALTRFRKLLLC
jgi:polysaccharide biosynthesis PFTS motif protein